MKNKVLVIDEYDAEVWELITKVPKLSKTHAVASAVVNAILPGFGTILATCLAETNVSKAQLMIGLMQTMLSFFLIGYFWSLYWSYLFIIKAWDHAGVGHLYQTASSGGKTGYSEMA